VYHDRALWARLRSNYRLVSATRPISYGVKSLLRDQGVGGSNPLSPTNLFHRLHGGRLQPKRALRYGASASVTTGSASILFRNYP